MGREGLSKGLSNGLSNGLSKGLSNDFQKDFHMTFKRTFKMTFKRIFKWMFERFSKICEKPLKNVSVLKKALQNKMFLGQITARYTFLNVFFAKKVKKHWFYSKRCGGRSRSRSSSSNKDTPRYTVISRRVTHARNANTNTKHDFPVGGVTKDSPPQPPPMSLLGLGTVGLSCAFSV